MKWNEEQQPKKAKNFLDDLTSNILNDNTNLNPEQNNNYEQKKNPAKMQLAKCKKRWTNGPLIEHRSLFRQQQSMTRGQSAYVRPTRHRPRITWLPRIWPFCHFIHKFQKAKSTFLIRKCIFPKNEKNFRLDLA